MHPRFLLEPEDYALLELWRLWRGSPQVALLPGPLGAPVPVELGRSAPLLPFAGGPLDQPACVMASFEEMDRAERLLRDRN